MKRFFDSFKKNSLYIFRVFLFIITIAVIAYFFPGKFRYEYEVGNPWSYKTLLAPFNFPIYKSTEQLDRERDSLLKFYKPYFEFDSNTVNIKSQEFLKHFKNKIDEYINLQNYSEKEIQAKKQLLENKTKGFEEFLTGIFQEVYAKGIIESSGILEDLDNNSRIIILEGNIAKELVFNELFTQKLAYEYVLDTVNGYITNLNQKNKYIPFYKSINPYEYIAPNIFYDANKSDYEKSELLTFSDSKGMVQSGEKIVSEGDIIDAEVYNVLESFRYESESKLTTFSNSRRLLLGQIIFISTCILVLFLFLLNFRKEILQNSIKTIFILLFVLIFVVVSSFIENSIYIVPFAIVPIVIRTFYDSRLALFIHVITVLLVGFFAPNGFEFVFLNFIAGIIAIFSLTNYYRRGGLFLSAIFVFITYSVVYFGLSITQDGTFKNIDLDNFKFFAFNSGLLLLSYPLIYIFEKTFGFLSDLSLMELSDTNQKLLRNLAEKAPGTFQHSMQVANLAEEAIYRIGGNPLLVRIGALYHDIGKMKNPFYFIENQRAGFNPHDMHEFDESANIIISHVKDGVELAKKNSLPEQLIEFIRTHHGTTKVQYFYRSYIKKFPDKDVDVNIFTYPGPKPYSKEMAVLMMADSVEAASRSYSEISEEKINNLVESIITDQMNEGQFDYVDINFKDITNIKAIFKEKLLNIYHARIKYPEKNKS